MPEDVLATTIGIFLACLAGGHILTGLEDSGALPKIDWRRANGIVLVVACLYALVVGGTTSLRIWSAFRSPWDIGIYDQILRNWATHGAPISPLHMETQFGLHLAWVQALPLAIYWFAPSIYVLLWSQVVTTALAVVPLLWLAREVLPQPRWRVAIGIGYFCNPVVTGAAMDYHPIMYALPLISLALWQLRQRRYRSVCLLLLLALTTKEEIALLLVSMGVFLFLVHRQRRLGAGLAVFGLAYMLLAAKVVIPWFSGREYYYGVLRYASLGGSLGSVLLSPFTRPLTLLAELFSHWNGLYVLGILTSFGFLFLAAPEHLLLALPTFFQNALSNQWGVRTMLSHAQALLLLPLMWAMVLGARRIIDRIAPGSLASEVEPSWWRRLAVNMVLAMTVLGPLGQTFWIEHGPYSKRTSGFWKRGIYWSPERRAFALEALDQVPEDKLLAASRGVLTLASDRLRITWWPTFFDAEYVLLDIEDGYGVDMPEIYYESFQVLADYNFGIVWTGGPFVLLARGHEPAMTKESLIHQLLIQIQDSPETPLQFYRPDVPAEGMPPPTVRRTEIRSGDRTLPKYEWDWVPGATHYIVRSVHKQGLPAIVHERIPGAEWIDYGVINGPGRGEDYVQFRSVDAFWRVSEWSEPFMSPVKEEPFPTFDEFLETHGVQ